MPYNEIWEPLTKAYIYYKFNLTEGGQLMTVVSFTVRTGTGLEIVPNLSDSDPI
jgi:hypothetical protein